MRRLGIFGGTFDPPHIGHLIIAQMSLIELELDKVLFIPCGNPPHKNGREITDSAHRYAMVQNMIAANEGFAASDMECTSAMPSYTANTLARLQEQYPETELFFIVGADSIAYMKKWWHPEEIFSRCTVAVAARQEVQSKTLERAIAECEELYSAKVCRLNTPIIDISSSEIRNSGNLMKFRYLLTEPTIEYIERHGLYKNTAVH